MHERNLLKRPAFTYCYLMLARCIYKLKTLLRAAYRARILSLAKKTIVMH